MSEKKSQEVVNQDPLEEPSDQEQFFLLPLRDVVIFPQMVVPLFVGRKKSIEALNVAAKKDHLIFVTAQKDIAVDDPKENDLYQTGCLVRVIEIMRLPNSTMKIVVEGVQRARIKEFVRERKVNSVRVEKIEELDLPDDKRSHLLKSLEAQFIRYADLCQTVSQDTIDSLHGIDDACLFADLVVVQLPISIDLKQASLEIDNPEKKIELTITYIQREIEWMEVDQRIQEKVKRRIARDQRKYVQREKLRALQQELGEEEDGGYGDLDDLEKKINKLGLKGDTKERVFAELNKLKMMSPLSAEATVVRNYIDVILSLPWSKKAKFNQDLKKAMDVLDHDHYGLEKVKKRIVENLAVQLRVEKLKGPIICLVGPPGVGKTSLGQSAARAMGVPFVRVSLGGVRDESEIRGHRKTYIGAMPGRIIKSMRRTKVVNPLIMLDEIDKMGMDYRGDPASALLEVLDPEQNSEFNDHYLDVDYDLSNVLFMTTANSTEIPAALQDRMEVIELSGYMEEEKENIAFKHLVPKILKQHGLNKKELNIPDSAIKLFIQKYTREPGVRGLERCIAKVARKTVHDFATGEIRTKSTTLSPEMIKRYLGPEKYDIERVDASNRIGLVHGLAWTASGGDLLSLEALVMNGKGQLVVTGNLGDVMKESVKAALSLVRERSVEWGVAKDFFQKHDFHVHFPEGATPKDGPSAGIGISTAILSAVLNRPILPSIAMTGEVTLRGRVLPIGGLREKLLAAVRSGIKIVIIPQKNAKDLTEIPPHLLSELTVKTVQHIDEVFALAIEKK